MAALNAPVVEYTLVGALLRKDISLDDLDCRTLSHTGQKIWRAVQSLLTANGDFDVKGVVLTATEVFGVEPSRLKEYMGCVQKHETRNAVGIYDLLRRRHALINISNEIQAQLGTGQLDLDKISGYIASSGKAKLELTSISDDLAAGQPEPPHGPKLITLPRLSEAINGLHGLWLVAGLPGIGKALALDTPIPTPHGWAQLDNLNVGDRVFDENGRPCEVVGVSDIWRDRPCFEVKFADGSSLVADAEHQWEVITQRGTVLKRTVELTPLSYEGRPWAVLPSGELDLPDAALPLSPYVLGFWLGDGDSSAPRLTVGAADIATVIQEISREGLATRVHQYQPGSYRITLTPAIRRGTSNSTLDCLRRLNVIRNKHIPVAYLRASWQQRLALLQGLVDSDGTTGKFGRVEISSKWKRLADDIAELVASLGMKPTVRENRAAFYDRDCGIRFRVGFETFLERPPARLPRKLRSVRPRQRVDPRSFRRYIVSVAPTNSVPTRCIQVNSASGLFLAGRGMVRTHNSTLARQITIDACRELPAIIYDFENTRRDILYQIVENFGMEAARKIGQRIYIRESLRTLNKDLAKIPPPAIVLVDSIQRVPVKSDDYLMGLNNWINRFEEIKQQGYSVILVSEINRASYSGEPRLDCFKESGRLEYACTFALVLQDAEGGFIRPYIVKNRHFKTKGPLELLERNKPLPFWFKELEVGI